MRIKRSLYLLITILFILSLTACGTAPTSEATQSNVDPAPASDADSDDASDTDSDPASDTPQIEDIAMYPRTLQDMALREFTLEKPVERIVSGYYISTSVIMALNVADKLVGIEAGASSRPLYTLAGPVLLSLPDVGTARDFNIEACLALEPDLVILPIRLLETADILTDMGVAVMIVNPESAADINQMIMLIGIATETKDRGELLVNFLNEENRSIEQLVAEITDKPTVFVSGNSSYLSTAGSEMFQASLIELAGGINAASEISGDSRQEISYELLLSMNPDVFIIPPEAAFDITEVTENPQLAELNAVRNGRVYQMPDAFEAWDSPVPSSILGIRWLLSVLHEDAYSLEDMRQTAFDFYKLFYDIEIDVTLINK
jgi:iron complex transport system substrate-binding protein